MMPRRIQIAICVALMAGISFAQDHPQTEITNGIVHTKVYLPDAKTGYYRGTRFDWSGVISDLEYAGHDYYPEWFQRTDPKVVDFTYDGADIVAGICCAITGTPEEFASDGKALGFDEAKAGGTFIKIGIGVLRKPDDAPYDLYRLYDIVDGGKWSVSHRRNSVEFTQELSDPSTGYAYVYKKTVTLTEGKAQMVIDHSLRNTGTRVIRSSVYDHNFLFLDRQTPGPDFVVTVPYGIQTDTPPDKNLVELQGNQIVFKKMLSGTDRARGLLQGFSANPKDYDIRIENRRVGAGVRVTGDRPLTREVMWSIRAPLSIEPYIDMNIAPGAEFTWKITYDYYTLPKSGN